MKFITLISAAFLLTGCETPRHEILGTKHGWNIQDSKLEVLLDAQVGKLKIRRVKMAYKNSAEGSCEHLEVAGEIGPDSTAAIERLLPQLTSCTSKITGNRISTVVFLSSGGGLLKDGFKLGEIFRKYQVTTFVTGGQACASSCAIAFLGGKYRRMHGDAKLLFHAPYYKTGIAIDCTDRGQVADLKSYYVSNLGDTNGEFLLNRTLSYCTVVDGWTLNADGAKLFGITND
jgi:ATP-dependent protease ClpP protease subunit